jgi:hypothetical protein
MPVSPADRSRFNRHAARRPEFWRWVLAEWARLHGDARPVNEVLGCSPDACEDLGLWLRPRDGGHRQTDLAKVAAATGIDPAKLAEVLGAVEASP